VTTSTHTDSTAGTEPADRLAALGWDAEWEAQRAAAAHPDLVPGRVARADRTHALVHTATSETHALLAGVDVITGDWVLLAEETLRVALPRRTALVRGAGRRDTRAQVLAANVDVVLIVTSINEDMNLRRLERYLTLAWESGAKPVFVLTKADLADDVDAVVKEVESIAFGVPVVAISNVSGAGLDVLRSHLGPGVTAALLGSSGVGKSTLVNTLLGEELLETREIRDDGKGRHTTTRRELVQLPGGALVIDTPGMREIQLWVADEGLEEAFEDVTELFGRCRFSDCGHESEPGCAVKAAIEDGSLSAERWESYLKLQRELAHLERRIDKRAASEERKKWKALSVFAREAGRAKGRR
jgi:ribosome biogenesis GTPase / thiamine phosphate phosphatase